MEKIEERPGSKVAYLVVKISLIFFQATVSTVLLPYDKR